MFELDGIDHVALSVKDIERAAQWYVDVLGLERRHEGMWDGVPAFVGKGTTALALFPIEETRNAAPAGPRMLHLAFRAARAEFLKAQKGLEQRGIPFEFQDHEISQSIYFRDTDGHQLEITTWDVG